MHNAEAINTDLPPDEKWTLSKWVKAIQQGNVVPCSEHANQMLLIYMRSAHVNILVLSSCH
eukprot:3795346-Karenia_brevis.AAC.1